MIDDRSKLNNVNFLKKKKKKKRKKKKNKTGRFEAGIYKKAKLPNGKSEIFLFLQFGTILVSVTQKI